MSQYVNTVTTIISFGWTFSYITVYKNGSEILKNSTSINCVQKNAPYVHVVQQTDNLMTNKAPAWSAATIKQITVKKNR